MDLVPLGTLEGVQCEPRALCPSSARRTVRRRAASTSIMPRSRLWQSGGMKCGMWNTPRFTFSSSCRRLSSSKGSAPCRPGTRSPQGGGAGWGGAGREAGGRDGGVRGGERSRGGRAGCRRTGAGAGVSPPAGRTGSHRSSTRPPCGRHTSPPAKGTVVGGGRARGLCKRRVCEGVGPSDRQGLGEGAVGAKATYPDHLGAGIVGGPEGKSSSQDRLGVAVAPPMTPGLPPGPQRAETERGASGSPHSPHTPPGKDATLRDPRAHQKPKGSLVSQPSRCPAPCSGTWGLSHTQGCPAVRGQGDRQTSEEGPRRWTGVPTQHHPERAQHRKPGHQPTRAWQAATSAGPAFEGLAEQPRGDLSSHPPLDDTKESPPGTESGGCGVLKGAWGLQGHLPGRPQRPLMASIGRD